MDGGILRWTVQQFVIDSQLLRLQSRSWEHVTVALSGSSGDKLRVIVAPWAFDGAILSSIAQNSPRKIITAAVGALPDSGSGGRITERMKRFVKSGIGDMYNDYMGYDLSRSAGKTTSIPRIFWRANGFTGNSFRQYFWAIWRCASG